MRQRWKPTHKMICLCLELTSTVQSWGNKSTHPSNMWQLSSILFTISQLIRKNSFSDVIISHLRLNTSGGFDKTWQPEFSGLKTGVMVFLRKFSQIRVEKHVRHFQPLTPLTWEPIASRFPDDTSPRGPFRRCHLLWFNTLKIQRQFWWKPWTLYF